MRHRARLAGHGECLALLQSVWLSGNARGSLVGGGTYRLLCEKTGMGKGERIKQAVLARHCPDRRRGVGGVSPAVLGGPGHSPCIADVLVLEHIMEFVLQAWVSGSFYFCL